MTISPDTMTVPVWQEAPAAPRPALAGDLTCDVVVIGAGVGGLSTAWHLAERGIAPVVIDRRSVASGASGRNGGFFIAGLAPMYDDAVRELGRGRAARAYRATLEAQDQMLEVAEVVGARADFRVTGMLRLGVDALESEGVRSHHAALVADGLPGELVAAGDLPAAVRRPDRLGLVTPHDGTVQPYRWLTALAAGLEGRGVRIYERTTVTAPPERDGDGAQVRTDRGTIRAGHVVVAVDGGLAALVPGVAVCCKRLNMVATAPAPPGTLPQPVYARDGREYTQQLADGRITLGGFADLDDATWGDREELSIPVQERLTRYLRDDLGVEAPVTHRWAGLVGYGTEAGTQILPTCGFVPGSEDRVIALGGYNGTGHVHGFVAGRIAAGLVAADAGADRDLYAAPGVSLHL